MARLVEPVPTESRAAIAMAVVESDDSGATDAGRGSRSGRGDEGGSVAVALLLAIAAVAAAVIGTRASMVSSDASDAWQSALRTEEKRAAGAMLDIQQVYQVEVPAAIKALEAGLLADELAAAAADAGPDLQPALRAEQAVQGSLAELMAAQHELGGEPYALPSGGFDLGRRLADVRASTPDMAALDPDAIEKDGDRLANKALLLTYALLPISLCALLGVLAQPLRRYRLVLLGGGSAFLVAGSVLALTVEVMA